MPAETVTLVTGAASGIGRATVEHLTRIGGRVDSRRPVRRLDGLAG